MLTGASFTVMWLACSEVKIILPEFLKVAWLMSPLCWTPHRKAGQWVFLGRLNENVQLFTAQAGPWLVVRVWCVALTMKGVTVDIHETIIVRHSHKKKDVV